MKQGIHPEYREVCFVDLSNGWKFVTRSGTRKEELLVPPDVLKKMYVLRRILMPMGTVDAIEFLLDKLKSAKNNADFFESMNT